MNAFSHLCLSLYKVRNAQLIIANNYSQVTWHIHSEFVNLDGHINFNLSMFSNGIVLKL